MTDKFTDDQIEELLQRTRQGEPLLRVCEESGMPKRRTVYDWLESKEPEHVAFAAQFHAARAQGIHALAEQCLSIADEPSTDAVQATDKRIRIDTRLRLAGKWLPSIYGDKTSHEVTGKDGGAIETKHDMSALTPEQLRVLASIKLGGE